MVGKGLYSSKETFTHLAMEALYRLLAAAGIKNTAVHSPFRIEERRAAGLQNQRPDDRDRHKAVQNEKITHQSPLPSAPGTGAPSYCILGISCRE
jgi:hypothetical protein